MNKIKQSQRDKLKNWRDRFGYSQEDAAKVMRVPTPTLRNWEQLRSPMPGVVLSYLELSDKLMDETKTYAQKIGS